MLIDTSTLAISSVTIKFEGGVSLELTAEEAVSFLQTHGEQPDPEPEVISVPEEHPVFEEPTPARVGNFVSCPETKATRVDGGYDLTLLYGGTDKVFRVRFSDTLLARFSGDVKEAFSRLPSATVGFNVSYVVETDEAGRYCRAVEWVDIPTE